MIKLEILNRHDAVRDYAERGTGLTGIGMKIAYDFYRGATFVAPRFLNRLSGIGTFFINTQIMRVNLLMDPLNGQYESGKVY